MNDVYIRLAEHLKDLIMGYPYSEALIDMLKEMFNPVEAQVALAIPNNLAPLEVVDTESDRVPYGSAGRSGPGRACLSFGT